MHDRFRPDAEADARPAPPTQAAPAVRLPRSSRTRALVVVGALLCALTGLAGRLVYLQGVQADTWRALADRQHRPVRNVAAYRGDIRTADGKVLARSIRVRSAFAEPRRFGQVVRNQDGEYTTLPPTQAEFAAAGAAIAGALGYDREKERLLVARLSNPRTQAFCWIERRLPEERASALAALSLRGVGFKTEYRRAYPAGSLAAHILGFTRLSPEGDLRGATGLEQAFEAQLAGRDGRREVVRDRRGRSILTQGHLIEAPEDGDTITLTIDSHVQAIAERAAANGAAIWSPDGVAVVVLDPRDGRILALASHPTYDPADLSTLTPEAIRNRPVMDAIEPGSTIKPLIGARAVERRVISPHQIIPCKSPFIVAGKAVKDVHPHGDMPFAEVIAKSSNVGAVWIALAFGPPGVREVLTDCGFGRVTGLGIRPEENGRLPSLANWKTFTTRSVAQGYGFMVTPLQLASAFGALAAEGIRYEPQIVERMVDVHGRVVTELRPREAARIVDAKVCREVMVPALQQVVEAGTAKTVRLSKWTSAGKTGTAEKVIDGRYARNRYRVSFVGFAPAEAPRLLCLVMVDDPRSPDGRRPFGGTVAGPIVKEIFEETLPYLRVPPSPGMEAGR